MSRTSPEPPSVADLNRWRLDPTWSRFVEVDHGPDGVRRWHVLDRAPAAPGSFMPDSFTPGSFTPGSFTPGSITVVCVHGNPTWSQVWAPLLAGIDGRHRVVAADQLGMGYSERTGQRRYTDRVDDLDRLIRALDVDTPIVLVAHDWGGAVAMGWAVAHPDRVAGLVLANTGIAVPEGRRAPMLIRAAAARGVLDVVARRTLLFVRGTARLPGQHLDPASREALRAPYRRAAHRGAIAEFVADVPFTPDHPSARAIAAVADRLGGLDVPALLVWGARDPVFNGDFAADLMERLPRARLHRLARAGHLSMTDPAFPEIVERWIGDLSSDPTERRKPPVPAERPSVWSRLEDRREDSAVAFHDVVTGRSVTFRDLVDIIERMAARLIQSGVAPGDRVAILTPPSVEKVALMYACWRIGAVTVIADRGLGLRGLGNALRGARVQHTVGPRQALAAARTLRWAPHARHIDIDQLAREQVGTLAALVPLPAEPGPDTPAAVFFTSGATGPAKGVRYTHGRFTAQRDALVDLYGIGPDDRLVAAFAPFAVYGPGLGITSTIPDVDVTAPGKLTAAALDAACAAVDATMVFASPAALANVVATAEGSLEALGRIRTVMSAGAPVPIATLRAMARLAPRATLHTPYGMTEALPVADVDLTVLEALGPGRGVCVGRPVGITQMPGADRFGCDVMVAPLDFDPGAPVEPVESGITGEILVRSPWMSAGYDGLWHTERAARPVGTDGSTWHRSGDVGHLDAEGRLWVEGRSVHVIHTLDGPVTPVPIEVQVEQLDGVGRVAAVGVGPRPIQQVVVVIEAGSDGLADVDLTERVRAAVAPRAVAAVCTMKALPVDIRHNAKIDRASVADRMESLLAGGRR